MRVNGTITYRTGVDERQFDDNGQPIIVEPTWSDPLRCFIRTNLHDHRGTSVGGTFTREAYEVLLERVPDGLSTDRVRLVRDGKSLGEFAVQDIQNVSLDRIRIIV